MFARLRILDSDCAFYTSQSRLSLIWILQRRVGLREEMESNIAFLWGVYFLTVGIMHIALVEPTPVVVEADSLAIEVDRQIVFVRLEVVWGKKKRGTVVCVADLVLAGSLEDIPSSNTTKIEYLYAKENNIQRKDKVQALKCKSPLFDRTPRRNPCLSQQKNEFSNRCFASYEGNALNTCHGSYLFKGNIIKIFYHGLSEITQEVLNAAAGGIFLYKTPNQAYQLLDDKVLLKLDWAKNQKTKSSLKKTVAFADEELQSRAKQPTPDLDDDDMPMSRKEEAKFMQTFCKTRSYNDCRDRDLNRDNWHLSGRNDYNRDNYRSNTDDKPYDLQKQFNDFMKFQQSTNAFVKETFMDLKTQLETVAKNHQASIQNLESKFDRLADKQFG
ncbi:hypothetical protein Tco_1523552 [Tanacetum coccineum]